MECTTHSQAGDKLVAGSSVNEQPCGITVRWQRQQCSLEAFVLAGSSSSPLLQLCSGGVAAISSRSPCCLLLLRRLLLLLVQALHVKLQAVALAACCCQLSRVEHARG